MVQPNEEFIPLPDAEPVIETRPGVFFDITLSFPGGGEGMVRIELPPSFTATVMGSTQTITGTDQVFASFGAEGVTPDARQELERIVLAGFEQGTTIAEASLVPDEPFTSLATQLWGWKIPSALRDTPEEYKRAGHGRHWQRFDPSLARGISLGTVMEGAAPIGDFGPDDPNRWMYKGKIEVIDIAEAIAIQADADNLETQMFATQEANERGFFSDEIEKNRTKWTRLVEGKNLYDARKQSIEQKTGAIETTAASAGGFGIDPISDWYQANIRKVKSGELDYNKIVSFDEQDTATSTDQTGVTDMADFKYPPGSYAFIEREAAALWKESGGAASGLSYDNFREMALSTWNGAAASPEVLYRKAAATAGLSEPEIQRTINEINQRITGGGIDPEETRMMGGADPVSTNIDPFWYRDAMTALEGDKFKPAVLKKDDVKPPIISKDVIDAPLTKAVGETEEEAMARLEETAMEGAFRAGMAQRYSGLTGGAGGGMPAGLFGRWAQSQFDPYFAAFQGRQQLGAADIAAPGRGILDVNGGTLDIPQESMMVDGVPAMGSFQRWTGETSTPDVYRNALATLGQFRGMDPSQYSMGSLPEASMAYINPQTEDETRQALALLRAASRARYSPAVAGMMNPRGVTQGDVWADWARMGQGGMEGPGGPGTGAKNFLDYTARRFGL